MTDLPEGIELSLDEPLAVRRERDGTLRLSPDAAHDGATLVALLPPLTAGALGDRSFRHKHGVALAYVVGEMAHGIAGEALVHAAAEAGVLAFFGAAGLDRARVERALAALSGDAMCGRAYGVNLIHQPADPDAEAAVAALLVRHDVRRVSTSAFMGLTPAVVHLAFAGARALPDGGVARRHLFAKVSRPEVARHFLAPPPAALLDLLVREGTLTPSEAALARRLPVADHVTVEADSGGHTDNRPLGVLLPLVTRLRDELARTHGYAEAPLVGAAGGLGDPAAIAAAFMLGAAYVLTGSINQAAREAATSPLVKRMLADADVADCAMAPAADMFELGARVQVLKRGTMFAQRAARLLELYREHGDLDEIPRDVVARLERDVFRQPLADVERDVHAFFAARAPAVLEQARRDAKARMALVFRWYLGKSSRWAESGTAARAIDFQVWCGPAMGAFNRWAAGTPLADLEQRGVGAMAHALMDGAARAWRRAQLRALGV